MTLADDLSDLIGSIYEASNDERAMQRAMERTLALTGAQRAMVTRADPGAGEHEQLRWYGHLSSADVDRLGEYESAMYALDPTFSHVRRNPRGRTYHSVLDPTLESPTNVPYLRWVASLRVRAWSLGYALKPDGSCFGISLHHDSPDLSTHRRHQLFGMLFEHFDRALQMSGRADLLAGSTARLIVDARGTVVSMNPAAEEIVAECDGILLQGGSLTTSRLKERSEFARLLSSALTARSSGGVGGAMQVSRPSGRRPLHVLVDPLPRGQGFAAFVDRAVVTLIDGRSGVPDGSVRRWQSLWGLTAAEARLAGTLLETECNLARAAERLCIGSGTARTHLARIFRKTHTKSQPELVRLLTRTSG